MDKKISHKTLCSHIFIIHNDHTYITGDYTKLCLNIICNRSFFYFEMMSALFWSEFYTRMKRCWGENINLDVTQLFDLNARIQQLTWSLIFYEKYSTSLSAIVLMVLTTPNFGGFSNFCRYYTRSQAGKSTGYRPTLKPLGFSWRRQFININLSAFEICPSKCGGLLKEGHSKEGKYCIFILY